MGVAASCMQLAAEQEQEELEKAHEQEQEREGISR
jgi:hypothetical protein